MQQPQPHFYPIPNPGSQYPMPRQFPPMPAPPQQQFMVPHAGFHPNHPISMGVQTGAVAPAPGFSSQLQQKQYMDGQAQHMAEMEVRNNVSSLSGVCEQMLASMRSAPASMFADTAGGPKQNPTCGQWCVRLCCKGCGSGSTYEDPTKSAALQNTISRLTYMEGNVIKMISSLNMGTKHLTEDQIFSAQLATTFTRVVELVELMRRYRAAYVSDCCACFQCCMTDGFGGEPAVKEIAEKLEQHVKQVRGNFRLDIDIGGTNRMKGNVGNNVEMDVMSSAQIGQAPLTRVVMTNQGDAVAMMDVPTGPGSPTPIVITTENKLLEN